MDLSAQSQHAIKNQTKHPSRPVVKKSNDKQTSSVPKLPPLTKEKAGSPTKNPSQSSTTASTVTVSLGTWQEKQIIKLPKLRSKPNSLVWIVSFDQNKVKVSPTRVQTVRSTRLSEKTRKINLFPVSKTTGKLIHYLVNKGPFHHCRSKILTKYKLSAKIRHCLPEKNTHKSGKQSYMKNPNPKPF